MKSKKNEINVMETDCFVNIRVDGLNDNSLYLDQIKQIDFNISSKNNNQSKFKLVELATDSSILSFGK